MKVVLSGSGILYPLHAGALEAFVKSGYSIDEIVGVSGGAIVGGAVASGYSPGKELNRLILDTLPGPNNLLDPGWFPVWNWGIYKGDKILGKFRKHMVDSFEDTEIPFKAISVNLNTKEYHDGTKFSLPRAVRASMTFPFVFEPVEDEQGNYHVDGGVAANFPVDYWGKGEDTVGFQVRTGLSQPQEIRDGICGIMDYAKSLVGTMIRSINREHIDDAKFAKTVVLNSKSISPLDLKITKNAASSLIARGREMVLDQLDKPPIK